MMPVLYRSVTTLAGPLIRLYLWRRMAKGKEDRARFSERLGIAGRPRPPGKVVWMHGASVGESMSLLPLIERLGVDAPDWHVLLTTGTVTSATLMEERLSKNAFHQYVPVDRAAFVRRFFAHWRPDLMIWAESEFWPNMIDAAVRRRIPMILVQGRVSAKSFAGWQRFPGLIKALLSGFHLCLAQTEGDARRLSALGAKNAKCVGNLKFASAPLPVDEHRLQALEAASEGRPRWLSASTHAGEEAIAGRVHRTLAAETPGLLSLIVPRHPGRGVAIAADLRRRGFVVALRSAKQVITPEIEIYVADTLGELGLFYRLSPIVFIGKTLVAHGGQNPLEAARLETALLAGPNMANFQDIADKLKAAGAMIEVGGEDDLARAVAELLANGEKRRQMGKAASGIAATEAGVIDAVMRELTPYLDAGGDDAGA